MPPLDPKLPQPPPGLPQWRQTQAPAGPPSFLDRLGMVGLSALPIAATVAALWIGSFVSLELFVGGIVLGAIVTTLLIMAQVSPNWRKGARITLFIFSCIIMVGTGVPILIIALFYAACSMVSP